MSKKKLTIVIVALVIGVIALALGTSYALFTFNVTKGSNFKTLVGKLELSITDTINEDRIVINDLVPTKEEDALQESGYTFTVTNTGSIDAAYTVYLDDVVPQGESKGRIADNLMRANLTNSKSGKNYTFSLENNRILDTGVLTSGESITYTLRLWLDYNAGNEAQNKYFAARIRIDSVQSKGLALLKDIILEQNKVVTSEPTLTTTSQEANEKGLYKMSVTNGFGGQDGDTYYFRGNVTNNYVSFAGYTWRIVRINEDGTIRLIMQDGINNNATYKYSLDESTLDSMYYSNSNAKTVLDNWYQENIVTRGFNEQVAKGNYFCEQAKVAYDNNRKVLDLPTKENYDPNLNCDSTGLVNTNVGLITYDEVKYAGDMQYSNTSQTFNLYLDNGKDLTYWTMSPAGYSNNEQKSYIWRYWRTAINGTLSSSNSYRFRPVINLKANVKVTGNGTSSQPYVVVMDEDTNYQVSSAVAAAVSQFNPSDLKDVIMCDQTGDKYINCKIYNTIDAALADRDTGTIIVTDNISTTNTINIVSGQKIIVDLNGKELRLNMFGIDGDLTIINSKPDGKVITTSNSFNMGNSSKLTVRNVKVESGAHGIWITGSSTKSDVDVYDSEFIATSRGIGLHGTSTNANVNIYGNTYIRAINHAVENNGTDNVINIYGGTYISENATTIRNSLSSTINIVQTNKPIYVTSLVNSLSPAIVNYSSGTINISGSQADACTNNLFDTKSGLCVYAEGDRPISGNTGNCALQNTGSGTVNINGGTYYGYSFGVHNRTNGTLTITNAYVRANGKAAYNQGANSTNGILTLNGGTYISDNDRAVENAAGMLNINQTDTPMYLTSLANAWRPVIQNSGSGTATITANQANNCTSNVDDTISGLCVYAEGTRDYAYNTSNGALQNSTGTVNINGGTYYGGNQGLNNGNTGTLNVKNAKVSSGRYAILNNSTGIVNVCDSVLNGSIRDFSNSSTGTINYNNVTFSNGTTTPGSDNTWDGNGGTTVVSVTCPISE